MGDKRGRTLGFPTANISLMNAKIAIPQYGVYAGLVKAKGAWYKAMLNVGNIPPSTRRTSGWKPSVRL